jgi:hypothetical protein
VGLHDPLRCPGFRRSAINDCHRVASQWIGRIAELVGRLAAPRKGK